MQGGNPLIQFAAYLVAGFSRPRNIDAVKVLAAGWINDMFAGTHDGIYAAPGETIQIDTDAGTASAIALPAPPTAVVADYRPGAGCVHVGQRPSLRPLCNTEPVVTMHAPAAPANARFSGIDSIKHGVNP